MAAMQFEWDENKRLANAAKHGIDFRDAVAIWEGPVLEIPSPQSEEQRWLAIGRMNGRIVAVVFVRRGGRIRIISARGTRQYEREAYEEAVRQKS